MKYKGVVRISGRRLIRGTYERKGDGEFYDSAGDRMELDTETERIVVEDIRMLKGRMGLVRKQ